VDECKPLETSRGVTARVLEVLRCDNLSRCRGITFEVLSQDDSNGFRDSTLEVLCWGNSNGFRERAFEVLDRNRHCSSGFRGGSTAVMIGS
jgi:hypothetical protein